MTCNNVAPATAPRTARRSVRGSAATLSAADTTRTGAGVAYEGVRGNNNCVLGNVDCNPSQMAANDIDLWKTQAAGMLPSGDVVIVFDEEE